MANELIKSCQRLLGAFSFIFALGYPEQKSLAYEHLGVMAPDASCEIRCLALAFEHRHPLSPQTLNLYKSVTVREAQLSSWNPAAISIGRPPTPIRISLRGSWP
jgi:hypothetical protein